MGRHECRCTTVVSRTLHNVSAADQASFTGRTTALLWRPAAARLRGAAGGTGRAVVDAVVPALIAPGYRQPIPAPKRGDVETLVRAGNALNTAVKQRYVRGAQGGAIAAAAVDVAAAARRITAGTDGRTKATVFCVGKRDRLVWLSVDPTVHAAMAAAAAANDMSLGEWIRDGVAADVGEHQARRAASETHEARAAAGRIAGLLAQAGAVATGSAELQAIGSADDELAAAAEQLNKCGSRR